MALMIALSVLLWSAAVTRTRRWWQARSVFAFGAAIVFTFMASHTTVNIGPIDRAVSDALGVPNATSAVKHVVFLGICLGASLMLVALRVTAAHAQRRWVAPVFLSWVAASAAALAFFFSAARVPQAETGYQFDKLYAHLPGYAEAAALVMGVAAVVCTMITIVVLLGWDVGTPEGRGLAILAPGVAILAFYAWMRTGYITAARAGWVEPTSALFDLSTKLAAIGILFTATGLMWASAEGGIAVRLQRRDIAQLHRNLVGERWPGVARDSHATAGPVRYTEDRASEVLDALSMQARRDGLPEVGHGIATPESIADWLRTGEPRGIGVCDLRPPADTDAVKWVRSVGRAYRSKPVPTSVGDLT
ncbi:hypothetical protein BFN03_19850 [Rhodococcus sp. WMMA185]|uniref:hypothetical protein n=1 Tax=Rhodococcus sp. WMMA185 TaxID=679318 RepID=UPI0008791BB3|nr:hypothetical protein [Rhodococcus sp. WMMA185]AOW94177.1 hypothetical protein BFN03_19850 [Rhodococcus sp. WMMA185]